ncbi:hypothetical protein [Halosimplex pelagicum]|uniref:Uncharacterized protein n=1 Tax=Halosimplex pelagicum TaxID=869886 RepID=A0A7D5TUI8_9EURY|nr:hypothetical protein [Halosimplex pelagicum]QLH82394.1 hypothetical protein HZS54_12540 [Halosimplex pelagicum]
MPRERTVIYVPSIDEASDRLNLPVENPVNDDDWGLVAEGYAYVRIEFVYSEETVRIARTAYNRLCAEYPAEAFALNNATKEILDVGSDAILDLKHGEVPLKGIENEIPKAVATVFAMQANEGLRDWPAVPEGTSGDSDVPPITAVEPVYPDVDAETSRWVSCTLEWDADREVFVNSQADPDWELDDEAAPDTNYIVYNQNYGSLEEAMVKALEDTEWEQASPTAIVEPDEGESPEWGTAV